jgi:hypothetical protein
MKLIRKYLKEKEKEKDKEMEMEGEKGRRK